MRLSGHRSAANNCEASRACARWCRFPTKPMRMPEGAFANGAELIAERVGLTNRIGAVLATLGVSDYSPLLRNRARRLHRYSLERVLRPSATIRRRRADTTCTAATPCTISSGSDLSMFGRLHRRTRLCAWQPGNVALIRARTGGMRVLSHSIWPMGRTRFVPR